MRDMYRLKLLKAVKYNKQKLVTNDTGGFQFVALTKAITDRVVLSY